MQGVAFHWVQALTHWSIGSRHKFMQAVQAVSAHIIGRPAHSCTEQMSSALQRHCALESGRHHCCTATNDGFRSALPSLQLVSWFKDFPRFVEPRRCTRTYHWTPTRLIQSTYPIYCFNINFNIMLTSLPRSSKLSLFFRRWRQTLHLPSWRALYPPSSSPFV